MTELSSLNNKQSRIISRYSDIITASNSPRDNNVYRLVYKAYTF